MAVLFSATFAQAAPDGVDGAPSAPRVAVDEECFVMIGGIEQWVTIHGNDSANPVILFLHGGPGNPISPYEDNLYGGWKQDFTLVQWDQRGAGRTYGRNAGQQASGEGKDAPGQLSVERMAQDGIEVANYVATRLSKRKLILFGGSWSSILAVHMAKARPELFAAYVGTGQIVNCTDNLTASYRELRALAMAAGDTTTVSALAALGSPPWKNPRNFGILRRATRRYEAKTTQPAPAHWWQPAPQYASAQALADYEGGEDFSYLQFVGLQGDGMFSRVDLPALGATFALPVFLFQGAEDLVTVPDVAKRYFDSIVAPQKDYILLPRTGHDPNPIMVEAQFKLLKERVAPLALAPR